MFPPHQQQSLPTASTPSTMNSHLGTMLRSSLATLSAALFQSVLGLEVPQVAFPWGQLWRSAPMTVSLFLYLSARNFQSLIHLLSGTLLVYHSSLWPYWSGRCLSSMTQSPISWHRSIRQSRTSRDFLPCRLGLAAQLIPLGVGLLMMSFDQGIRTLLNPRFLISCSRSSILRVQMPCTTKLLVQKPNQAMLFRMTAWPEGLKIWFLLVVQPMASGFSLRRTARKPQALRVKSRRAKKTNSLIIDILQSPKLKRTEMYSGLIGDWRKLNRCGQNTKGADGTYLQLAFILCQRNKRSVHGNTREEGSVEQAPERLLFLWSKKTQGLVELIFALDLIYLTMGACCQKVISVQLCLLLTLAAMQYKESPFQIQAQSAIIYSDTTPGTSGSKTVTLSFSHSFSVAPLMFYGTDGLNFYNSQIIEYSALLDYVSATNFNMTVRVGSQSQCVLLSQRIMALYQFTNITTGLYSNYSRTIGGCYTYPVTGSCIEGFEMGFLVPKVFPFLSAVILQNPPTNNAAAPYYYSFRLGVSSTNTTNRIDITFLNTTRFTNFTFSYLAIGVNANSLNQIAVSSGISTYSSVVSFTLTTAYTAGYTIPESAKFIGMVGFTFSPSAPLQFSIVSSGNTGMFQVVTLPSPTAVQTWSLIIGKAFCDPPLYLAVVLPTASCWICDPKLCTSCKGVDLCGGCVDPKKYLVVTDQASQGGICTCSPGYVFLNGICTACASPCLECVGTASNCTKCQTDYKLLHNQCLTKCYLDLATMKCGGCSQGCKVCDSSGLCLSKNCSDYQFSYEGKCVKICPNGTFNFTERRECRNCSTNCLNCSAFGNCKQCKSGTYLNKNGFCSECDQSCLTCSAAGNSSCTSCSQGYLQCGVCKGYKIKIPCKYDQYSVNDQCLKCSSNCLSCASYKQCFSCQSPYLLENGSCISCASQKGYKQVDSECQEVCGDGIRINAECDDGNRVNGDGCSENCTFEYDYVCEDNTKGQGHGDICYKFGVITRPTISIKRNNYKNAVKISMKVNMNNIPPVTVACKGPNNTTSSYALVNQSVNNQEISIILTYQGNFQDHTCSISVTQQIYADIIINTQPPSYYIPNYTLMRLGAFSTIMRILMILSLVIVMVCHLLVPSLTSTFVCNISLYVVSFFNNGKFPAMALSILPAFREMVLAVGWGYEQDEYSTVGELGFDTAELWMGWPYFAFFGGEILLVIVFRMTRSSLPKTLRQILRTPINNNMRFIHSTFIMYEPLMLMMVIFSLKKQLSVQNVLFFLFYLVSAFSTMYMLWKITCGNRSIFLASDGPSVRVQIYLYTIPVAVTYPAEEFFAPFSAILYVIALFCSRTYFRFKEWQHKREVEQLRTQSDIVIKKPDKFVKKREKIEIIQQFFNDLFFIINNFLILVVSFQKNISFQTSLIITGINLCNLLIFTLVNLLLILWGSIAKIYYIHKKRKRAAIIHPEIPEIDDSIRKSKNWSQNQIRQSLSLIKNKKMGQSRKVGEQVTEELFMSELQSRTKRKLIKDKSVFNKQSSRLQSNSLRKPRETPMEAYLHDF